MPAKKNSPPNKKSTNQPRGGIQVGNISHTVGDVNIAGGDVKTRHTTTGLNAGEIQLLFDGLYASIQARPNTSEVTKEDLKTDVQTIQEEITKVSEQNRPLNESLLARQFRNIARMAPDILDTVVKTLLDPGIGIADVVAKIATKAREGI